MNLHALKEALFARGAALGFTDMEIFYQSTNRFSGNIFKGEIDRYTIAVDGGLAFRGRLNGKMGYAYTELIDDSAIEMLLDGAQASSNVIDSTEEVPLFAGPFTYETLDLFSETLDRITPEERIALLKEIDAACYAADPRVALVNPCQMEAVTTERLIANTRGLERGEKLNRSMLLVRLVVREGGDSKTAIRFLPVADLGGVDPGALAREVVDEALSYLGAEPLESGAYPILLRRDAAASLLAAFVGIFSAENVQKGRSLLKGKLGQVIASEAVTLIDDPFLAGGFASRSFDSEGVPSRRVSLIEGGRLNAFLYNLKAAAVDAVPSTGHGAKASYKGAVGIAPSNLYLKPGALSFEEMVAATEEAVIITSLQGLHSGANAVSGDFSLAASGYYVKGGKIVRPVNQITVAGNFFTLLQEVEEAGADLEFSPGLAGYLGAPTLRIKSLAVAGR